MEEGGEVVVSPRLTHRVRELELRHTFTISRSSEDVTPVSIVEFEHEGMTGLGEASPSPYYDESVETVARAIDAFDVSRFDPYRFVHELDAAAEALESNRGALCALDLAVHDWISRRYGEPLYRLFGLDPARIPVSSFTVGIADIDTMVEKLREASEYPIIKIKLGTDDDLGVVRALRRESKAVFRVDANCAWTVHETIEKSHELAALGVEFIEQPLPPDELDAMEEVYRRSALPVIADENSIVPCDVPKLAGRFHGINIKLVKCGGIQPALRMVHVARTLGMEVMYGCMIESSVGITAAAQIGALADYVDLDGNVLITNDPYVGVRNEAGRLILSDEPLRPR